MKSKLEEILNNVIDDFNTKWKSHEEKSDGILQYIEEILALQQPPVSVNEVAVCSARKSYLSCDLHHDNEHGCIECGNYEQTER